MSTYCRLACILTVFFVFTASLGAQPARYELGRRLRVFEEQWDRTPGEEARKRCAGPLNQAVIAFFTFRYGEAGRLIDDARMSLDENAKPTPSARWAESLALYPAKRLLDSSADELAFEVKSFYDVPRPKDSSHRVRVVLLVAGKEAASRDVSMQENVVKDRLPLKGIAEGDHTLRYEISEDKRTLASGSMRVSFVNHLQKRVAELKKVDPKAELTTERASLTAAVQIIEKLADGKTEETDYPAARLLQVAELASEAIGAKKTYFTRSQPGEHWLYLVAKTDANATARAHPLRIWTPAKWNEQAPPTLVVALHGAGGSENMFFDTYGNGKIVKLCQDRNWMLVAPRVGFSLPLASILDELHTRYPFDRKKVLVIGHSMGAAATLQAVCAEPKRYAAAVALGGSGTVKASDDLKKVPFLIACGSQDFALAGARGLKDRLSKSGVEQVTFREMPNIEHLGVVQQALPESFAFFDQVAAKSR